ncbi:MAG: glutamate synthase subunit beta [Myxococcota bacterium]
MSKIRGFLEHHREEAPLRPVEDRVQDWNEVYENMSPEEVRVQATRCMDCGVPFCNDGCPVGNIIPDWNDLVYRDRWRSAIERLHATNNFPEFTGLVCPAPCEAACVLGINDDPVTIKRIEWEVVRRAWEERWIKPQPAPQRTGKSVAVIGSGPAGMAAAQQLARAGHDVVVFERNERPGGLLRFGIPDFKLEKWIIERRLQQLGAEGVEFRTGVEVGTDVTADELRERHDAVLFAIGCEDPRPVPVEGADLEGVHYAMDFLAQQNRRIAGLPIEEEEIVADGKTVVVLGGGDTGSDCVGTAHRQGAKSVVSLELMEKPPQERPESTPWPMWPAMYRTSTSHAEGGIRRFGVLAKRLEGDEDGHVRALHATRVRFSEDEGSKGPEEIPGTGFEMECDLLLIAIGYTHPIHEGAVEQMEVGLDQRGNIAATTRDFATSVPGVFAAGDCRKGQSLVVHAIWEGREAARHIDRHLMGDTHLPSRDTEH